ncbi:MAG: tRNA (guanosine(18)-2'-O)-methyltransferase TrmH [Acidobacteriota bacterium]|nr:tRNA (guanosine(18)-2'-O)-methyltransferase TrmH [Acidobacteriota bacterium]
MTPKRFRRLRQVLGRRQPDLTVLLENVHKPHNFAAVLRTADAVGLFEAHAVIYETKLRTSLVSAGGSDKWIDVKLHNDIGQAIDHLRDRGFVLLGAHPGARAIDYRQVDFTQPTALLLGQEKDGLTPAAREAVDDLISIPMTGFVDSLNVSVAAAVLLFEAHRQRSAAGMFENSRLAPEIYDQTLFEWAQPRLADYCRRHDLPYPALDENGQPIDPPP